MANNNDLEVGGRFDHAYLSFLRARSIVFSLGYLASSFMLLILNNNSHGSLRTTMTTGVIGILCTPPVVFVAVYLHVRRALQAAGEKGKAEAVLFKPWQAGLVSSGWYFAAAMTPLTLASLTLIGRPRFVAVAVGVGSLLLGMCGWKRKVYSSA